MRILSGLLNRWFGLTLLLTFGWLLVLRASYIAQSGIWPNLYVVLASDLAGALILALLLGIARGPWRALFVILLGSATFAAGVHLAIHGTLFQLSFIGKGIDPTFLAASLANTSLLLLPVHLGYAWLLHFLHRAVARPVPSEVKRRLAFAALVVLVYGVSFQSLTTPANNVVASAIAQVPGALVTPFDTTLDDPSPESVADLQARSDFFYRRVAAPDIEHRPNVLLIMIEGLSGGYFPGLSEYHGLDPAVELGELERYLAGHGFRLYRNALSMERQTDRGTFAILCGAYPDFRRQSTKMIDVAENRADPDCMPEHLRQDGYHTAYWQAAPLEYMQKENFMPRIGFSDVTGAELFDNAGDVEGWGPPDEVYFANITERILGMNQHTKPWFVTLLNVGTHHPFDTGDQEPAEDAGETDILSPPDPQANRRRAMEVMSESLIETLDALESAGIMEDTLVIITSDESGGFIRPDPDSVPLSNNLGVLAVRPPGTQTPEQYADQDRIVAQIDIPLTILDAVGLGDRSGRMIGRSLMVRDDPVKRDLLLADAYTGMKYFLRESGRLLACTELLARCTSWRFDPERLFGTLTEIDADPFLTLEERAALFDSAAYLDPVQ